MPRSDIERIREGIRNGAYDLAAHEEIARMA